MRGARNLKVLSLGGLLAAAFLAPIWLRAADADKLAGEAEQPARPAQRPAIEAPEEQGPVALTRSPLTTGPSFKLPEMVITGEGEAKAMSQRSDLALSVDTSGGIKASPGEQGGKDQAQAEGSKATLQGQTFTAKPSYGQLSAAYGSPAAYQFGFTWGLQQGDWSTLLNGQLEGNPSVPANPFSGGGPNLASFDRRLGSLQVGYQLDKEQSLQASVNSESRDQQDPFLGAGGTTLSRWRTNLELGWDGSFAGLFDQTLQLDLAQAAFSAGAADYTESRGTLKGVWDKEAVIASQRHVFSWEGRVDWLSQAAYGGLQGPFTSRGLAKLALEDRFEALPGGQLGLGLEEQTWFGSSQDTSFFAPRVEWNQRVSGSLNVFAVFKPRMSLPAFSGDNFGRDLVLPNPSLLPERDLINVEAGIHHRAGERASLEAKVFYTRAQDAIVLDDPGLRHVWTPVNSGNVETWGAEASAEADLGWQWRGRARVRFQAGSNLDNPGRHLTYFPAQELEAGANRRSGAWEVDGSLRYVSSRFVRQTGDEQAGPILDLAAKVTYHVGDWLAVYAEGRNLLLQDYQEWYGYPEPRPYFGLGANLVF